jgi:hypothetical protein
LSEFLLLIFCFFAGELVIDVRFYLKDIAIAIFSHTQNSVSSHPFFALY